MCNSSSNADEPWEGASASAAAITEPFASSSNGRTFTTEEKVGIIGAVFGCRLFKHFCNVESIICLREAFPSLSRYWTAMGYELYGVHHRGKCLESWKHYTMERKVGVEEGKFSIKLRSKMEITPDFEAVNLASYTRYLHLCKHLEKQGEVDFSSSYRLYSFQPVPSYLCVTTCGMFPPKAPYPFANACVMCIQGGTMFIFIPQAAEFRMIARLQAPRSIHGLSISPDGASAAAVDASGRLYVLQVDDMKVERATLSALFDRSSPVQMSDGSFMDENSFVVTQEDQLKMICRSSDGYYPRVLKGIPLSVKARKCIFKRKTETSPACVIFSSRLAHEYKHGVVVVSNLYGRSTVKHLEIDGILLVRLLSTDQNSLYLVCAIQKTFADFCSRPPALEEGEAKPGKRTSGVCNSCPVVYLNQLEAPLNLAVYVVNFKGETANVRSRFFLGAFLEDDCLPARMTPSFFYTLKTRRAIDRISACVNEHQLTIMCGREEVAHLSLISSPAAPPVMEYIDDMGAGCYHVISSQDGTHYCYLPKVGNPWSGFFARRECQSYLRLFATELNPVDKHQPTLSLTLEEK